MKKKFLLMLAVLVLCLTPVVAMADSIDKPLKFEACWNSFEYFEAGSKFIQADKQSEPGEDFGFAYLSGAPGHMVKDAWVDHGILKLSTIDVENPRLILLLPNFENDNPRKKIVITAKFQNNFTLGRPKSDPEASHRRALDPEPVDGTDFFIQELRLTIEPNPSYEEITIPLNGEGIFALAKLCVKTKCIPDLTPIPGSFLLLGSSLFGLIVVRIRKTI